MTNVSLEIACFNPESAVIASRAGAHRIEICEDLFVGGKTPSDKVINEIISKTGSTQRVVMIHKLGSSYVYTKRDFQWMVDRIGDINEKDIHGYVFGAITERNELDIEKLEELVTAAENKPCTFHRAFDSIADKGAALEQLIELGFKRVLTAGGDGNAIHNVDTLAALNKQANGRISIIAAGGIRAHNVADLIAKTGVKEVHSSAILRGDTADESEIKKILEAISK